MPSFLDRYQNGEHVQVWKELLTYGSQVRDASILPDAEAVTREAVMRAKQNIELLVERLRAIDYNFINPHPVAEKPADPREISSLSNVVGSLPLSISIWYELIGEVDFAGFHPNLANSRSHKFPKQQLHPYGQQYQSDTPVTFFPKYSDPFSMFSFEHATEGIQQMLRLKIEPTSDEPYHFDICEDFIQKANESGSGTCWIALPNSNIDALLIDAEHSRNFRIPHTIYFVDYLRLVFKWGGFPGFEWYNHPNFKDFNMGQMPLNEIAYLTKDLLPL